MIRLPFLSLAFKRLGARRGLTAVLLGGYVLVIGLLVAVPVYVDAIALQILQQEIDHKMAAQGSPPFALRFSAMPAPDEAMTLEEAAYAGDWIADLLQRSLGLPLRSRYMQRESPVFYLKARPDDTRYDPRRILAPVQAVLIQEVAPHLRVVEGAPFGEAAEDATLNVWMAPEMATRLGMAAGDLLQLEIPYDKGAEPIPLRIVGIWEARAPGDRGYWPEPPDRLLEDKLLTTEAEYREHIYPARKEKTYYHIWYYVFDEGALRFARADKYVAALRMVDRQVGDRLPAGRMEISPLAELERGLERRGSLEAVLLNLSLPLQVVLLYLMGIASLIMATFQRHEVAMLASRGSSLGQMLLTRLLESALLLGLATPLGMACGLGLVRLLEHARGFMRFGGRTPLAVHLGSLNGRLLALGVGLATLTYLLPAISQARQSIVAYERWSARRQGMLGMLRLLWILLLVAAAAYGTWRLVMGGAINLIGWRSEAHWQDPLLLLTPTLFLVSAALLASEFIVALMRLLAPIARRWPTPSGYLGGLMLAREGNGYRAPLFLMALCLGLGIFAASLASSAERWLQDHWRYVVGADLVIGIAQDTAEDKEAALRAAWLPIGDYARLPGVQHAARVGSYYPTRLLGGERMAPLRLLGVDHRGFAAVVYFRDDYASLPLGELMNRLGSSYDGLLLPTEVVARAQLDVGDRVLLEISLDPQTEVTLPFVLVGSYKHLATMMDTLSRVAVANLDYVQEGTGGPRPYDVWLRLEADAAPEAILEGVWRLGVTPLVRGDLRSHLARAAESLERAGLYGMLSLSFMAAALCAGVGLLLHGHMVLASRQLRYAVWQAMGLHRAEVIATVALETLWVVIGGLIAGLGVGILAARIYGPLYRLIEGEGPPMPPFVARVDWLDASLLLLVMALYLVLLQGVILWRLQRLRIFEALRMGGQP